MIRHVNPTPNTNRTSKAPYNFIPLPEKVMTVSRDGLPRHDRYIIGRYTGWIDLTITAETPLYVRCGPKVEDIRRHENPGDDHTGLTRTHRHRQDFFHHGNPEQPVLPGSSIRGMIRSLVEILSFGKLQWFTDKQLIYRAVGDTSSLGQHYRDQMLGPNLKTLPQMLFAYPLPRLRGGYLEKDGPDWKIQPAREFPVANPESFVHVEDNVHPWTGPRPSGRYTPNDIIPVFVRPPTTRTQPPRTNPNLALNLAYISTAADIVQATPGTPQPAGFESGFLVRSGHMTTGKHMHCVIYEKDTTATPVSIPRTMWELYEEDRNLTRGIPARELKQPGDPLFYLVDPGVKSTENPDGLVFFGPTMMFRLPYTRHISDFIPQGLRNPQDIDLSEAIFGTVDRVPGIKGRVYFEDARWDGNGGDPFLQSRDAGLRSPKILSGPKPTSFQHYLVQPSVNPPNGASANGADDRLTLHNWDQPTPGTYEFRNANNRLLATGTGSIIRGHKRYWHKQAANPFEPVLRGNSTQHTIIRPVKENTTFTGRVRFENLLDVELGALLTALQLPQGKRHQIGMGKPLGMGSVKITAALHLTERTQPGQQNRYTCLFADSGSLHLGELPPEQNQEVESRAKETFRKATVRHHNSSAASALPADTGLWTIPRLSVLALMLESNDSHTQGKTDYEPLGNSWKERRVLPTPQGVVGVRDPDWGDPLPPLPLPRSADRIRCKLLKKKQDNKGWRILWIDGNVEGDLLPAAGGQEPSEANPDQEVELVVNLAKETKKGIELAVRWPPSSLPSGLGQGKQKKKK
jgi:CRISPR-associated protein (TIGR03986 family)